MKKGRITVFILLIAVFCISLIGIVSGKEQAKPTLKYLGRFATFDLQTDPCKEVIEKVTGYNVEWSALPEGEAGLQKLLIISAAGIDYDIVAFERPSYFGKTLSNNVLQPLDSLIRKYGKNIKAAYKPSSWAAVTSEGKIYGLPYVDVSSGAARSGIIVRMDVLESLGLKMPTNLDEFEAVLRTVKEKRPEMVPLTVDNDGGWYGGYWVENTMSAFGMGPLYLDEGGKLVPFPKQKNAKSYLTFMNKLYKDGLLDYEMPALKRAGKNEKFASGKAFMAKCDWWEYRDIAPAARKYIPGVKIEFMPFLADKSGKRTANAIAGVFGGVGIPKTAKHPADSIKFLDALLQTNNFRRAMIGDENVHYEVKNNEYYPKPQLFVDRKNAWFYVPALIDGYKPFWMARLRAGDDHYYAYTTLEKQIKGFGQPEYLNMAPPMESVSKYQTSSEQYIKDQTVMFITGALPLSDYDKFVTTYMNEKGGAAMEADYNKWFKANRKNLTK